jgi:hypothetical protein
LLIFPGLYTDAILSVLFGGALTLDLQSAALNNNPAERDAAYHREAKAKAQAKAASRSSFKDKIANFQ